MTMQQPERNIITIDLRNHIPGINEAIAAIDTWEEGVPESVTQYEYKISALRKALAAAEEKSPADMLLAHLLDETRPGYSATESYCKLRAVVSGIMLGSSSPFYRYGMQIIDDFTDENRGALLAASGKNTASSSATRRHVLGAIISAPIAFAGVVRAASGSPEKTPLRTSALLASAGLITQFSINDGMGFLENINWVEVAERVNERMTNRLCLPQEQSRSEWGR